MNSAAALAIAERLHDDIQRDPIATGARCRALLDEWPIRSWAHPRAVVRWAAGRCEFETGNLLAASSELRRAVASARRCGQVALTGRILMSLAVVHMESGRGLLALRTLDQAEGLVTDVERPRIRSQRSLVHFHRGDLVEADREATLGLAEVTALQDDFGVLRQRVNRAIVRMTMGRLGEALDDLDGARPIAQRLDQAFASAVIDHNAAVVYARLGQLPRAIGSFDAALRAYEQLGSPARVTMVLESDRSEALLHAGLLDEARQAAVRAERLAAAADHGAGRAEAMLLIARCEQANGVSGAAEANAVEALSLFVAAGSNARALLCHRLVLDVREAGGSATSSSERSRLAADLDAAGWHWEALDVRLAALCSRLAEPEGSPAGTLDDLARLMGREPEVPIGVAVRAAYVTASAQLAGGDLDGALATLDRALEDVEASNARIWSVELRAGSSLGGARLADLGFEISMRLGDPVTIRQWAERWRAPGLRVHEQRLMGEPVLQQRLAELRAAEIDLRNATSHAAAAQARRNIVRRERAVATAARSVDRVGTRRSPTGPWDERRTIVVEFVAHRDRLVRIATVAGETDVRDVGIRRAAVSSGERLAATLARACQFPAERHRAAALAIAATLDGQLFDGLVLDDDASAVIIPDPALSGLAWSTLPTLARRPFSVAPSRSALAVPAGTRSDDRVVVVAGPDVVNAGAECAAVAGMHDECTVTVVSAETATVDRVRGLLGESSIAHLAAHGTFRRDNPLFSGLHLFDGTLHVYDLVLVHRAPAVVVLSSCHTGRSGELGGDLLGTVSVLLAGGSSSVIAPSHVVSDAASPRLMAALHRALAAGSSPGSAMLAVRNGSGDDVQAWATAALFTVYGGC